MDHSVMHSSYVAAGFPTRVANIQSKVLVLVGLGFGFIICASAVATPSLHFARVGGLQRSNPWASTRINTPKSEKLLHELQGTTRSGANPRSAATLVPKLHVSGTPEMAGNDAHSLFHIVGLSCLAVASTLGAIWSRQWRMATVSGEQSFAPNVGTPIVDRATKVLLLKDHANGEDPYEVELQKKGYEPIFIPVLRFEILHPETLPTSLSQYMANLAAMVITSSRSCESLKWALSQESVQGVREALLENFPVFGVGPKTCKALRELGFKNVQGDHTGSAAALGPVIIEFCQQCSPSTVLFLRGDKALDILPNLFAEAALPFESVVTYNTIEGASEGALKRLEKAGPFSASDWVCLFSPSGVRSLASLRQAVPGFAELKKFSIGKTTSGAIEKELNETAEAVAACPTAVCMVEAIALHDEA